MRKQRGRRGRRSSAGSSGNANLTLSFSCHLLISGTQEDSAGFLFPQPSHPAHERLLQEEKTKTKNKCLNHEAKEPAERSLSIIHAKPGEPSRPPPRARGGALLSITGACDGNTSPSQAPLASPQPSRELKGVPVVPHPEQRTF